MNRGHPLRPAPAPGPHEAELADYLRQHPDFFLRHPDLVQALQIPHDAGTAVSLVEHQVQSLRRDCQQLREQLAQLVDNARGNEELARRLHRLLLSLLGADRLDELLTTLYQGLEQGFSADMVSFRLFADPVLAHNRGLAEFVGDGPGPRAPFETLLRDMEPRCGKGEERQLRLLFGERGADVASLALVPISAGPARGVLALASRDASTHHAGLGTHYLKQLSDVVGALVAAKL